MINRNNEVDTIRMAALIGICIVNVPFMALPVESVFISPTTLADKTAAFFVECFFQLKFFILFSFIFGWGIAIQSRSAKRQGIEFAGRYFRRMFGLAIFGISHAILVFSGDILLLYALLGTIFWTIKGCSPKTLIIIAVSMMLLSVLSLSTLAIIVDSTLTDESISVTSFSGTDLGGSFVEATLVRFTDWPVTFGFLVLLQAPLAFGAFAAGLASANTDFFSHGSSGFQLLKRYLPHLLIVALPLNFLYASVVGGFLPESYEVLSLLGFVLIAIGAPALSVIYLYIFICLSRAIKIPRIFVLAGQNSLSSYIAQGIFTGFVFGSYGLGLFNSLGHAQLIPLSLLIAIMSMVLVGSYASIFGRGPLEPILRWMSGSK